MQRLALVSLLLMTACPSRTMSTLQPQGEDVNVKYIPVSADIDILLVIDNSASTADKQTIFSENFPKFVAALDAWRYGVIGRTLRLPRA